MIELRETREIEYNCVAGFMFSEDFKAVALIHKNRPDWQKGKVNAIGGKIEASDDSPRQAMVREFREETGVRTKTYDWSKVCDLTDRRNYKVYFFYTITDDVYDVDSKTDELVAVYPTDRIPKDVLPNLRWLIPMALTMAKGEESTYGFEIIEEV